MKKLTVDNIGVDAGMIMVADLSYLDQFEDRGNPAVDGGEVIEVPKGVHKIKWAIKDTWNGSISGEEEIHVSSGKIFVCDPCYVIGHKSHENWMKWLDDTEYGEDIQGSNAFVINEMGGDGEYKVELRLA